jgi:thymidine kinase
VKRGSLTVVCGPMYAGKTTYLLQAADKFTVSFKPSIDTRYDATSIASHDGAKGNAFAIKADATGVDALLSLSKSASVVLIDECQFLSDPFVLAIQAIQSRGSKVVCAGLDLDFLGQPFGIMPRLLCLADQVIKLSALCSCGSVARRTYRKSSSMDLIEVGSSDKYEPRCVDCFYK